MTRKHALFALAGVLVLLIAAVALVAGHGKGPMKQEGLGAGSESVVRAMAVIRRLAEAPEEAPSLVPAQITDKARADVDGAARLLAQCESVEFYRASKVRGFLFVGVEGLRDGKPPARVTFILVEEGGRMCLAGLRK